MGQYNVQEAKTHLSELLTLVERGEDVVIAKAGRPVARLTKIDPPTRRELGFLAPLHIPDDFYDCRQAPPLSPVLGGNSSTSTLPS